MIDRAASAAFFIDAANTGNLYLLSSSDTLTQILLLQDIEPSYLQDCTNRCHPDL